MLTKEQIAEGRRLWDRLRMLPTDPHADHHWNEWALEHVQSLLAAAERAAELETQLEAWYSQFGTTQLTHAVAQRDALAEVVERAKQEGFEERIRDAGGIAPGTHIGQMIAQSVLHSEFVENHISDREWPDFTKRLAGAVQSMLAKAVAVGREQGRAEKDQP